VALLNVRELYVGAAKHTIAVTRYPGDLVTDVLCTHFPLPRPSDRVFHKLRTQVARVDEIRRVLEDVVYDSVLTHARIKVPGLETLQLAYKLVPFSGDYVLTYPFTYENARRISMDSRYCQVCDLLIQEHEGLWCPHRLGCEFTPFRAGGFEDLCRVLEFQATLPDWLAAQTDSMYLAVMEALDDYGRKTRVHSDDRSR